MNSRVIYEGDWSFPVRKEFILDPSLSRDAKCLYLAIKSYCAPNQSTAFPSTVTLAKALQGSRRSIGRWADELEQHGLLKRSQEKLENGTFTHTLWRLYGSNLHEHI